MTGAGRRLPGPFAEEGNGGRRRGGRSADSGQATVEGCRQYLNTQKIRCHEWRLPSSISWPDDCFLRLDDDAICGRANQQLGDARRVDREDHVWTDRGGLNSPKALLTSRIKTGAIN